MADDADGASADSRGHTRRVVLVGAATIAGAGAAAALSSTGSDGNLYGGKMALPESYKLAEADKILYQGPDSLKSNITPQDGDKYEATDTQVDYYGENGNWEKKGVGSSSTPVPSVDTDDIHINNRAQHADYIVFASPDTSAPYGVMNGTTMEIEVSGESDAAVPVQHAIDARNGKHLHLHFTNSYLNSDNNWGAYRFETTATFDNRSLLVTGEGKNLSQLKPADGANTDIFEFNPSSLAPIYELKDVKFSGNKANNTSGSAVWIRNAHEIGMHNVEFRSFAEYGIKWQTASDSTYNKFVNTWVLDNDGAGIWIDNTAGGTMRELDLTGCTLVGGDPSSVDTGKPALHCTTGGTRTNHINITGGTLKGSDVILGDSVDWLSMTGVQGFDLRGNYVVKIGDSTEACWQHIIKSCQFRGDGSNPVTNGVVAGSNANELIAAENQIKGTSGTALVDDTDGTQGVTFRNNDT